MWFILGMLVGVPVGVLATMAVQVVLTMQAAEPPTLGGYTPTDPHQ